MNEQEIEEQYLIDLQDEVNETRGNLIRAEKALDNAERAYNKAYRAHWKGVVQ